MSLVGADVSSVGYVRWLLRCSGLGETGITHNWHNMEFRTDGLSLIPSMVLMEV